MALARFEILEIPGTGAHAAVCLAKDRLRPDRGPVCLKVLRGEFSAESTEAKRVRDEARLLALLTHDNIVHLDEQLVLDGRQVLVMEWVEGPPLSRVVRKLGGLPMPVALEVTRQIASAIHYAYTLPGEAGPLRLVHRDLNLDNVLMSIRGEVKILDYGLAKADFSEREAQTAISLRATPAYAAPEGLSTIADNPKLDVYALGISLFFMLTGHLPVLSRNRLAHRSGLAEQLDWLIREFDAETMKPLVALVGRMCTFEPSERPAMDEVMAEIDILLPEAADLVAFADREVHPLHIARRRREPLHHEAYEELMFLQGGQADDTTESGPSLSDQRVRAFLAKPGWASRSKELKWLLIKNPDWSPHPFLEILAPACEPWWKLLVKRPGVAQTLVALTVLAHRRSHSGVMYTLRALTQSRNRQVARLAQKLFEGEDISLM